jgi:membrane complex biogenesis BtpA family protein
MLASRVQWPGASKFRPFADALTLIFMSLNALPKPCVIGMLHLPALPGSPRWTMPMPQIISHALRDADALVSGGCHAMMLENFGDTPFFPGRVPSETIAAMTAVAVEVRKRFPDAPLGINVLRNDGCSAMAIAASVGAAFIRVNVLCAARLTDQGIIQGIAHDMLRDRARLKADDVQILADVDVKHSAPLAPRPLEEEIEETLGRGLADAVIVSGHGTGKPTDLDHVRRAKAAAKGAAVLVGSGVTAQTIASFLPHADGFIVGTAFKAQGDPTQPVQAQRVRDVARALGS